MGKKRSHEPSAPKRHAPASAAGHPSKKRRVYTAEQGEQAAIYDNLASDNRDHRAEATTALIARLPSLSEEERDHVFVRLVRGLCSPRQAARAGFFVALLEFFRWTHQQKASAPAVDAEADLEAAIAASPGSNSILSAKLLKRVYALTEADDKDARRDYAIGRAFTIKAILETATQLGLTLESDTWWEIENKLLSMVIDTPWLQDEIGMMLRDYFDTVEDSVTIKQRAEVFLRALTASSLGKKPEGVVLWLTISSRFNGLALPKNVWHHDNPLSSKELPNLAKVMCDTYTDAQTKASTGTARLVLGEAWRQLFAHVVKIYGPPTSREGEEKLLKYQGKLRKIWNVLVDEKLFHASASPERKNLGLQLMTWMIKMQPSWTWAVVLSTQAMRCIMNQRADAERYLYSAAKTPLDALVQKSKNYPLPSIHARQIVSALLKASGSSNFDQATKTKTLDQVLSNFESQALQGAVAAIVTRYKEHDDADGQEQSSDTRRRVLADLLVGIVRTRAKDCVSTTKGREELQPWVQPVLQLLTQESFFTHAIEAGKVGVPISETRQQTIRARLWSCLTLFISSDIDLSHRVEMPRLVLEEIHECPSTVSLTLKAEPQIMTLLTDTHIVAEKLIAEQPHLSQEAQLRRKVMYLLYAITLIQAYEDDADAIEFLPQLDALNNTVVQDGSTTEMDEALAEIILTVASRQSALCRKLAEQVMGVLASRFSVASVRVMTEVLTQNEGVQGQQALANGNGVSGDTEMADGDDVSVEGADASDVEVVSGDDEESGEDEEDDEDGDNSDNEEEDSSTTSLAGGDAEAEEFDRKLAAALQTTPLKAGMDEDAESSDDDDMNDEEMMAIEPHLARIFRDRKAADEEKSERRTAKQDVINLKNRVLDLLQIFVKQQYASETATHLILPLLRLISTTRTKQLGDKAGNVLNVYFTLCTKHKAIPPSTPNIPYINLLKDIHTELLAQDVSKQLVATCSRASLLVCKILTAGDRTRYRIPAKVYHNTQEQCWNRRSFGVRASFFHDFINWSMEGSRR